MDLVQGNEEGLQSDQTELFELALLIVECLPCDFISPKPVSMTVLRHLVDCFLNCA